MDSLVPLQGRGGWEPKGAAEHALMLSHEETCKTIYTCSALLFQPCRRQRVSSGLSQLQKVSKPRSPSATKGWHPGRRSTKSRWTAWFHLYRRPQQRKLSAVGAVSCSRARKLQRDHKEGCGCSDRCQTFL